MLRRPLSIALRCTMIAAVLLPGSFALAQTVTAPVDFFGHELGADRQLARWDEIVDYLEVLDSESDRLQVINLGSSTEDNPFLLVLISSPENLANIDRIAEVSRTLADPRGLAAGAIEALVAEGRAVVAQSLGLHSTEVAGAQSGPAIAYDMVSRSDPETLRILDETVMLLLPNINPDGTNMVVDWYRETVGTEYEGSGLPYLYHLYAGHDNNRDGDYLNLVESEHIAKVMYRDFKPQAYVDHHQMGSYGARMYVPPYSEPIRPGADPLQWRELAWYGAHIAYKLEEHGMAGILNAGQYPGWGHFGWHWITPFHNITGMLTESASATLATPLFIHPDQLRGGARGLPAYEAQSNMPNPWEGGWWRVSDIVKQQVIAARAIQDVAARNRETVLRNMANKALRQTERGRNAATVSYVIPRRQHDGPTAAHLVNTLLKSDVEIWVAEGDFDVDGMVYQAGTFVVPAAQPKTGLVKNLLGRTLYPDNTWTRSREGAPLRPYDTSTHTMAEAMGVRVDELGTAVEGQFARLEEAVASGSTADADRLRLDGRHNASYHALNLLLDQGVTVNRVAADTAGSHAGDFIVSGASDDLVAHVAELTGAQFAAAGAEAGEAQAEVERGRLGVYQRYQGGNMDEGWTRLMLEQFDFPYTSVRDTEIKAGGLRAKYDVILLPHDRTSTLMGGNDSRFGPARPVREDYQSGLGDEGVEALQAFVEAGGTLVAIGRSSEFAIEKFSLRVRDVTAGLPSTEFFCPGSTLRVNFDTTHPLAAGMPANGYGLFWDSPAFELLPAGDSERYHRVVTYVDRDILQSGWLIGEEHLSNKAAVVAADVGDGQVVLVGIRAQHRAQTAGTFKLIFNSVIR
jgi:hypothetical protein